MNDNLISSKPVVFKLVLYTAHSKFQKFFTAHWHFFSNERNKHTYYNRIRRQTTFRILLKRPDRLQRICCLGPNRLLTLFLQSAFESIYFLISQFNAIGNSWNTAAPSLKTTGLNNNCCYDECTINWLFFRLFSSNDNLKSI